MRARDIMSAQARCVGAHSSLREAARLMRDLGVGALPVCGDNNRLVGMVTDRDIVVLCCAEGIDPASVQAGTLERKVYWVDAEADAGEVLRTMEEHRIKRLPVIDTRGGHRLIGMITEADLARNLGDAQIAEFASRVYAGA
ncbi:CBS domain-containing protein [Streptomyces sp. HNM0574]|nr:CBS domain-containing protein [Streptomyces sp. HNM0574]NLU69165.1 CBS domain-containing protein [Streptomyces sp. HNM0574]